MIMKREKRKKRETKDARDNKEREEWTIGKKKREERKGQKRKT